MLGMTHHGSIPLRRKEMRWPKRSDFAYLFFPGGIQKKERWWPNKSYWMVLGVHVASVDQKKTTKSWIGKGVWGYSGMCTRANRKFKFRVRKVLAFLIIPTLNLFPQMHRPHHLHSWGCVPKRSVRCDFGNIPWSMRCKNKCRSHYHTSCLAANLFQRWFRIRSGWTLNNTPNRGILVIGLVCSFWYQLWIR